MIGRVWKIFHLLLTFFLLIKKKESFLFIKPIKADEIYYKISELGTSFIKLAQVLATRGDFFSGEYLNELKKVHDSLEAMDKSEVVEILKKSGVWDENFKSSSNFKNSQNFRDSRNFDNEVNFSSQNFDNKNFSGEVSKISALKSSENSKNSQNSQTTKNSQNSTKDSNKPLKFAKFDLTPIASASIGQVHIAYLKDGTKLAVKLRRTGIEKRVKQDIKIIKSLNFIFKPLFSTYTKHSIEAVISEFSDMILKEISMSRELLNLEKFSKTYAHLNITFPTPYKELSNDDMLVMSFESGFRFDDTKSVLASGVDIKVVLKKLVLFYVEQMLVKGYFHADPHPGNLLIKKSGELVLLDFGMVKSVSSPTRLAIIELLKAANEANYERYILACKRLGIIAYETPTGELAEFVAEFFEIFSNENLNSLTMQNLAFELMERTRKFPFKLPSEAIYILRVSAIIEGLGTSYVENFNGIKDILPILVKNIPRATGSKETLVESIYDKISELPYLINSVKDAFYKVSSGEIETQISKLQLSYFKKASEEMISGIVLGLVLVLTSFFLLLLDKGLKILAIVLFIAGIFRLLYRKF